MGRLIQILLHVRGSVAYALVFGLPASESSAFVGIVVPGELAVLLGGVMAFQGRISLAGALAASISGAIVGDSIGYAVGARWGNALLESRLGRRLVKPEQRRRTEELIRDKGGLAVFIGRFTTVLRVLVPGLAGTSGMPYRKFFAYNVLGGVAWASGFTLLGYLAGNAWRRVEQIAARASALLATLVVAIVLVVVAGRRVARNEDRIRAWWTRQLDRPRVQSIRLRYERQIGFLRQRLDPRGALGLYFTTGLLVSLGLGWGFGAALQDILAKEELVLFDGPIARSLAGHRSPGVTRVFTVLTQLGGVPFTVSCLAVASIVLVLRRKREPAVFLAVTVITGMLLNKLVKALVHRPRPIGALVPGSSYSFPSEHVVAAITLFGGLAFVISRLSRSWGPRVWSWVGAVILVVIAAISRVYLGIQYASDVVGGAALGATWLAVCSTSWIAWERFVAREPGSASEAPVPEPS
jgi:membrane protein DedA with SNARE-associated domain/membrane-associated phospholipid phosphatase